MNALSRLNRHRLDRRHCSALLLALCAGGLPAQAQTPPAAAPVVLVVGDSLSAEYGLQRGKGWVALLQERLQAEKVQARVVNASISGDTTSGGRSRLPALLKQHSPAVVVIELGGNDAAIVLDDVDPTITIVDPTDDHTIVEKGDLIDEEAADRAERAGVDFDLAARENGLQTAYIERPREFGAAHPKDVSPVAANTLHARDLLHLADLLGC